MTGQAHYPPPPTGVDGGLVERWDGAYYQIKQVERMEPFLMCVVSDSDLWMWASSSGVLTAGRGDADHALFPYLTDDRLHRMAGVSGPLTVIARAGRGGRARICYGTHSPCPRAPRRSRGR